VTESRTVSSRVVYLRYQRYNTSTAFAGYNRITINDLLSHWTPALPAVLP
jgi:hypothetical protein